jgi:hypothetical protein
VALENGMHDEQLIEGMVASPEYLARATAVTPGTRFVSQFALDLFGPGGNVPDLTPYMGSLDQELANRTAIATQLASTTHYHSAVVAHDYLNLLHRGVDVGGLIAWTGFLDHGGSFEQLAINLTGSPEYFYSRGGGTFGGFIDALYADALNRPADAASKANFLQGFGRGTLSFLQVATILFTSPEHDQLVVNGYYTQFLRRGADPQASTTFVGMLQAGVRDESVIGRIAGSLEYADARRLQVTSLNATSAMPGTLLTIVGTGFDPHASVSVHFFDDQGFSLTVPAISVSGNSVTVSVPPYLNPNTGALGPGHVRFQVVSQSGSQTASSAEVSDFQIQDLPIPAEAPGAALLHFLQAMTTTASQLQTSIAGTRLDTPAQRAGIADLITQLGPIISGIQTVVQNPSQTFTLNTGSGPPLTLGAADLRLIERIFMGTLLAEAAVEATLGNMPMAMHTAVAPAASSNCDGHPAADAEQGFAQGTSATASSCYFTPRQAGDAFKQAVLVVGASAGVAVGLIALVLGEIPVSVALAAGALTYVVVVGSLGLVGVQTSLGLNTQAARDFVTSQLRYVENTAWLALGKAAGAFVLGERNAAIAIGVYAAHELHQALSTRPRIAVSVPSLSFEASGGVATQINSSFTVTNNGDVGSMLNENVTFSSDAGWLTVTPGSTSDGVTVNVPSSLPAGAHPGTITVSDPNAYNGQVSIPVTLTIDPVASIGVNPTQVNLSATLGTPVAGPENLTITNNGASGSFLSYRIVGHDPWILLSGPLQIGLNGGEFETYQISADVNAAAGLGIHTGAITVVVNGVAQPGGVQQISIPVTLTVTQPALPAITITPLPLSPVLAAQGDLTPRTRAFQVKNSGVANSTLNYTVTSNATWATIAGTIHALGAGDSDNLQVVVTPPAGVAAGTTLTATITVAAPDVMAQMFTVKLMVVRSGVQIFTGPSFSFADTNPSPSGGTYQESFSGDMTLLVSGSGTPTDPLMGTYIFDASYTSSLVVAGGPPGVSKTFTGLTGSFNFFSSTNTGTFAPGDQQVIVDFIGMVSGNSINFIGTLQNFPDNLISPFLTPPEFTFTLTRQ